ncbi:MAG: hypothetical protein AAGD25_35075 [Cyanobacteria bacterium P01_F01_bin.150]
MVSRKYADHSRTSVNPVLKEIQQLQRDRRYRDTKGAFFIEGVRNFVQVGVVGSDSLALIGFQPLQLRGLAK